MQKKLEELMKQYNDIDPYKREVTINSIVSLIGVGLRVGLGRKYKRGENVNLRYFNFLAYVHPILMSLNGIKLELKYMNGHIK